MQTALLEYDLCCEYISKKLEEKKSELEKMSIYSKKELSSKYENYMDSLENNSVFLIRRNKIISHRQNIINIENYIKVNKLNLKADSIIILKDRKLFKYINNKLQEIQIQKHNNNSDKRYTKNLNATDTLNTLTLEEQKQILINNKKNKRKEVNTQLIKNAEMLLRLEAEEKFLKNADSDKFIEANDYLLGVREASIDKIEYLSYISWMLRYQGNLYDFGLGSLSDYSKALIKFSNYVKKNQNQGD